MLSITHGNSRTQAITFDSRNNDAIAGIHAHQARLIRRSLRRALGIPPQTAGCARGNAANNVEPDRGRLEMAVMSVIGTESSSDAKA